MNAVLSKEGVGKTGDGAPALDVGEFSDLAAELGAEFLTPSKAASPSPKPEEKAAGGEAEGRKPEGAKATGADPDEESGVTSEELAELEALSDDELAERGFTREQVVEARAELDDLESGEAGAAKPTDSKKEVEGEVAKLTKQLADAEMRAKDLEAKLEAAQPIVIAPTPESPLADVEDEATLQTRMREAQWWQTWAIENPDGGTVKLGEKEVELGEKEVKKIAARSAEILTFHAPERQKFLAARDHWNAEAKERYADLFEPGSQKAAMAREILQMWPEVKRFPDYMLVVGRYLAGMEAEKAGQVKGAKDAKDLVKKRARVLLAPSVVGATSGGGKPQGQEGRKKAQAFDAVLQSGGSPDALERFF